MRVLIIKGQSRYGGVRLFSDYAGAALARRGCQVEVLDLVGVPSPGTAILQHAAVCQPYGLIFTIDIAGEFKDSLGRTLSDLFGGPHVVWHTDYILSQLSRLQATPKSTALLVVDPTQADAVRAIYGPDRFDYLAFFPHPAVGAPAEDDATVAEFVARRPIGLLWSGSFQQPERAWERLQEGIRRVFRDALDLALGVEWMAPHRALDTVLASRGLDLNDPNVRVARELAYLLDVEVRQTRRFELLQAVAGTGLPITICGEGWESELHRFDAATFEGAVEMTRMAELMAASRVVLNSNGNFGAGSHERPFSASLAGAATFSDYSRYYAEVFTPGETIELFRWKALPAGMEALVALAGDPERCLGQARGAKRVTLEGHTWDRQVDLIFAAADAVRR